MGDELAEDQCLVATVLEIPDDSQERCELGALDRCPGHSQPRVAACKSELRELRKDAQVLAALFAVASL